MSGDRHAAAHARDPEGLSTLAPVRRRSPSGLLYPYPPDRETRVDHDRPMSAAVEIGWIHSRGDEDEARFREYLDPDGGPWLRALSLEYLHVPLNDRLSIVAGGVGRSDGYYRFGWLRPGRFDLRVSYDAIDHTYASDARVLHSGIGSERLSLPGFLVPGDNAASDVDAALSSIGPRRVALSRNESEVELLLRLARNAVLRSSYRLERRDGERPWGGTLGLTFGQISSGSVVETLEPIHQRTHDWSTRLEWSHDRLQANVGYEGSRFDNRREALVWENPFPSTDLGIVRIAGQPQAQMALAPDNDRHRVHGNLALQTPSLGRLNASASWSRMKQNETLLPATINPDIDDFTDLSRRRADASVDIWRAQLGWRVRPHRSVALSTRASIEGRDSDTEYVALNPATGQYGYVAEDLAPASRVGAVPFSHRRLRFETKASLRLSRRVTLGLEYEHQRMHRSGRARRETRDDRARVNLQLRVPDGGHYRIAYEVRHRGGSAYDPARDNAYYAPSPGSPILTGASRSLRSFRQFDLARHTSHDLELRSILPIGNATDLTLAASWMARDFGAMHGLQYERTADFNFDLTHRPDPRIDLHVFGSFEWRDRRLETIDSQPGPAFSFLPGSPAFPFANAWSWNARTTTGLVGTSSSVRISDRLTMSLDYRFRITNESTRSGFDRAGGALTGGVDPATAPTSFPAIRLRDHLVEVSATWRPKGPIEASLMYRMHVSDFDDTQQRGLVPRVNQVLFLGHRDRDFVAHLIGSTATFRY